MDKTQALSVAEQFAPAFTSVTADLTHEDCQVVARGHKGIHLPKSKSELLRSAPLHIRNTTIYVRDNYLRSPDDPGVVKYRVREATVDRRTDRVITLVEA